MHLGPPIRHPRLDFPDRDGTIDLRASGSIDGQSCGTCNGRRRDRELAHLRYRLP